MYTLTFREVIYMDQMEPISIPARRFNKIVTQVNLLDSRIAHLETGFAALAVANNSLTQEVISLAGILKSLQGK